MKKIGHILTLMMILSGCNDASVQNQVYEHGNQLVADYVAEFNSTDEEIYVQMYDNSEAEQFLKDNIPFFECPDKELEKTYYFRWWTYRKHI